MRSCGLADFGERGLHGGLGRNDDGDQVSSGADLDGAVAAGGAIGRRIERAVHSRASRPTASAATTTGHVGRDRLALAVADGARGEVALDIRNDASIANSRG